MTAAVRPTLFTTASDSLAARHSSYRLYCSLSKASTSMARSRISSCFCSCVRATPSSRAISWFSSSSSSSAPASLSPPPWPLTVVGALPPTRLGVCSADSSPGRGFLALRPRFFLGAPLAVTPLAALPLTMDVASTDGERA